MTRLYVTKGDRVYIERKTFQYEHNFYRRICGTVVATKMSTISSTAWWRPKNRVISYRSSPGQMMVRIKWDDPKFFRNPNSWWRAESLKKI